jgi:hypothetical protein
MRVRTGRDGGRFANGLFIVGDQSRLRCGDFEFPVFTGILRLLRRRTPRNPSVGGVAKLPTTSRLTSARSALHASRAAWRTPAPGAPLARGVAKLGGDNCAPQREEYRTRAEYRWAKKLWLRRHGGYLWTTLAIAIFFGALTGSTVLLILLVVFALAGTAYARSRP